LLYFISFKNKFYIIFFFFEANVGGVFVVLMGGMGIACVIAVCEFVWKSRKVAIEEKVMTLPDHQNYPSLLH
jgi:anaerobic C4-dicarboxylate transporter